MAGTTSFILVAILGALIIQCDASGSPKAQKDLNGDLNKHLEKINNYVKTTFDYINKGAQNTQSELSDAGETITTKIGKNIDSINQDIERLTKEAEENGKDVSQCASESLSNLVQIRENAGGEVKNCLLDAKTDIDAKATDYQKTLPDSEAISKELNDKFLACKNSNCQRGVIREARDKVISVATDVGAVLGRATLDILVSSAKGRNCMENVPISTANQSANILTNFIECTKTTM